MYTITRWLWNLTEYGMCMINDVSTVLGSVVPVSQETCVFIAVYKPIACYSLLKESAIFRKPYMEGYVKEYICICTHA